MPRNSRDGLGVAVVMTLLWLDLETTGLDARRDKILEVYAEVTSDRNESLATFHAIANDAKRERFGELSPVVQAMHLRSGLWIESLSAACSFREIVTGLSIENEPIEALRVPSRESGANRALYGLRDFVAEYAAKALLAGNSVHFDRAFLGVHAPEVLGLLHYRHLDCSAINEMAWRCWPEAYARRPGADTKPEDQPHRAIADVTYSRSLFEHYRAQLGDLTSAKETIEALEEDRTCPACGFSVEARLVAGTVRS